jgi:uncharacterized protein YciW
VAWYAALAEAAGAPATSISQAKAIHHPVEDATSTGAALRHADLLTTRPSAARKSDLDALKAAGFTPAGIVSLSQTIAFVAYQLRLVAGLRAFGGQE